MGNPVKPKDDKHYNFCNPMPEKTRRSVTLLWCG